MTKQKPSDLSDSEQSERFRKAAQELIDAGELDPTEADAALNRVLRTQVDRAKEGAAKAAPGVDDSSEERGLPKPD